MDEWNEEPVNSYRWQFKPQRELANEEMNTLFRLFFGMKLYDDRLYNMLPEELQEHFVEREDVKKK